MHTEPALVDCGWRANKRGGWWYREPNNRYTIQIVPSGKERRGWTLGIAHQGPIKWGRRSYPSPEAAAFTAFGVVEDAAKADELAQGMSKRHEERTRAIEQRLLTLKEATGE